MPIQYVREGKGHLVTPDDPSEAPYLSFGMAKADPAMTDVTPCPVELRLYETGERVVMLSDGARVVLPPNLEVAHVG